ncbi:MAG: hypothetical protein HY078_04800 [Elusimicrobia bacterium]|nr:hypothetical protein [Elusimicrobiota bacterium]
MRKKWSFIFAPMLVAGAGWIAWGQFMPPMMQGGGGDFEAKFLEELKKKSPDLYKYEKELHEIQKEIREVTTSYGKGELERSTAKAKLVPLMRSERQIRENPDYLAEQKLFMSTAMKMPAGGDPRKRQGR